MRKLLLLILLLISFNSFSQLNGYKYVLVNQPKYQDGSIDKYGLSSQYSNLFREAGLIPIYQTDFEKFAETKNTCELIFVGIAHEAPVYWQQKVTLTFMNCKNEMVYRGEAKAGNSASSKERSLLVAGGKVISKATKNYSFNSALTPSLGDFKFDFSLHLIFE